MYRVWEIYAFLQEVNIINSITMREMRACPSVHIVECVWLTLWSPLKVTVTLTRIYRSPDGSTRYYCKDSVQ